MLFLMSCCHTIAVEKQVWKAFDPYLTPLHWRSRNTSISHSNLPCSLAAPKFWNKIPISIRTSSSLSAFRKGLKAPVSAFIIPDLLLKLQYLYSISLFPSYILIVYFSYDAVCLNMRCDLFWSGAIQKLVVCVYVCIKNILLKLFGSNGMLTRLYD